MPLRWTFPFGPLTTVPLPSERKAAFRAGLEGLDNFQVDHPFPVFEREGYFTLDDFMEGFTWDFSKVSSLGGGKKQISVVGDRLAYFLLAPVSSPNPGPDPGTSNLLFNFFPSTGSPNPPVIEVRADDSRIFAFR